MESKDITEKRGKWGQEGRALSIGNNRISEYVSNNSLSFVTALADIFKQTQAAISTVFLEGTA
jgi:hypothetical protein